MRSLKGLARTTRKRAPERPPPSPTGGGGAASSTAQTTGTKTTKPATVYRYIGFEEFEL